MSDTLPPGVPLCEPSRRCIVGPGDTDLLISAGGDAHDLGDGGAGYIGSHTPVELLNAGSAVTVFDNFSNSHPEALARATHHGKIPSSDSGGDLRDRAALVAALRESGATSVIHFAGLKAVGESVESRCPITITTWWVPASSGSHGECGVTTLVSVLPPRSTVIRKRLPLTEDHPCPRPIPMAARS